MPIHLFDVAPLRPLAGGAVPTQALVVTVGDRVIAVDAGYPEAIFNDPHQLSFERFFLRLPRTPEFALINRLALIGKSRSDLTDIVLTHLHSEHALGIADFPDATIHLSDTELALLRSRSPRARFSYRRDLIPDDTRWMPHHGSATWQGIPGCTYITDDIVLVPLPGHTLGHCGVAVRESGDGASRPWILHTGDAWYGDPYTNAPAPFPLAQYEHLSLSSRKLHTRSRRTLERLAATPGVHLVSAHRTPTGLPLTMHAPERHSINS